MVRVMGSDMTHLRNCDMVATKQRSVSRMPRGPKGEKRPADVIGNAVHVMRIATGEIEEEDRGRGIEGRDKNAAAVELGRRGGLKAARRGRRSRLSSAPRLLVRRGGKPPPEAAS